MVDGTKQFGESNALQYCFSLFVVSQILSFGILKTLLLPIIYGAWFTVQISYWNGACPDQLTQKLQLSFIQYSIQKGRGHLRYNFIGHFCPLLIDLQLNSLISRHAKLSGNLYMISNATLDPFSASKIILTMYTRLQLQPANCSRTFPNPMYVQFDFLLSKSQVLNYCKSTTIRSCEYKN